MADTKKKTIFISYSHDSEHHQDRVLALSERLRDDGLDTRLDQYLNGSPDQGWPRWMWDSLDEATHVLVICTAIYYRRFRGHEEPGKGKGVDWEGALITQEIYDERSKTCKFVPVLFTSEDEPYVPEPLRPWNHYTMDSEEGYQALYDFLMDQAGVEARPLGPPKERPRRKGKPLRFASHEKEITEEDANTEAEAKEDANTVATRRQRRQEIRNKIRLEVEKELAKTTRRPLQEGFAATLCKGAQAPDVDHIVEQLFTLEPEDMLEALRLATEEALECLDEKGERITEEHIVWRAAKQMLGWLVTLSVRSEELERAGSDAAYDEIDVVTLVGVEVYTARKKGGRSQFQSGSLTDQSGTV